MTMQRRDFIGGTAAAGLGAMLSPTVSHAADTTGMQLIDVRRFSFANADKAVFEKHFRQVADWFDPFSRQALRESTYLIDKLIERF